MSWRLVAVAICVPCALACSEDLGATSGVGGAGGQFGTTTTSAAPSTSSAAGGAGGGGGMAVCDAPADCGTSECASFDCVANVCQTVAMEPKGTPCNENGGNVCGEGQCVAWAPLSLESAPTARSKHTLVWTGSHMLVWGGRTGPSQETSTGAAYDPATDSWSPLSTSGAPAARHSHTALWTGTEMIVWGGFGEGSSKNDGGAYDPISDTWRALAASPIPSRTNHVMEWSGSEVLIWGGRDGAAVRSDGARYDPTSNTWAAMPPAPIGGRFNVVSAWATPGASLPNGALVVWGGTNTLDWPNDGAYFDPVTNTWSAVGGVPGNPPNDGAVPSHGLEGSTSVWLPGSTAMFIWGGWNGGDHYDTGYILDMQQQVGGYWYILPPKNETCSPRRFHVSAPSRKVSGFFVWGGCADSQCNLTLGDGAYWWLNNAAPEETWTYIPEDPALEPRNDTAIINTGDEVVIWGGVDAANVPLATGARRLMPDPG